jgi:hypothetical protein
MSVQGLLSKYIASCEHAFSELHRSDVCVTTDVNEIEAVLGYARDYLKDAKYYRDKGRLEVSLTSIAYCEGMLDTLRLLGMVKFEWQSKGDREDVP